MFHKLIIIEQANSETEFSFVPVSEIILNYCKLRQLERI